MKASEIYELYKKGLRPVLECNEKFDSDIDMGDVDPNNGMRGRLVEIQEDTVEDMYKFFMDFGEFEEYNKRFAIANYYDRNMVPCETWFQQKYYERDKHRIELWLCPNTDSLNLVNNKMYEIYIRSKSDLPYITWLEDKLLNTFKYEG